MREFLTDEKGKLSSTRLVLFVVLALFCLAAFVDIFYDIDVEPMIYGIIQMVFGVGLGGTAVRSTVNNYSHKEQK